MSSLRKRGQKAPLDLSGKDIAVIEDDEPRSTIKPKVTGKQGEGSQSAEKRRERIPPENQSGDEDTEINNIMNDIEDENEDGELFDLDPEVEQMLADLEKTDEFGEGVSAVTARTFKSISQLTITKELTDKWKQELKTPENCQEVVVPSVNGPIWSGLPMNAKTNDAKMQALQQYVVRAQVAQMRLMDEMLLLVPKERMPRLLKPLLDSAKCLTAAMQEMNQRRRQSLRPHIRPEYASMNSTRIPVTSQLYGDDLEKNMKEAKVAANIVKSTLPYAGRQRFHPYRQFQNRQAPSLNFSRPSQTMGRGGLSYRNQRSQFQRNRPMFMRQQQPYNNNYQRRQ